MTLMSSERQTKIFHAFSRILASLQIIIILNYAGIIRFSCFTCTCGTGIKEGFLQKVLNHSLEIIFSCVFITKILLKIEPRTKIFKAMQKLFNSWTVSAIYMKLLSQYLTFVCVNK